MTQIAQTSSGVSASEDIRNLPGHDPQEMERLFLWTRNCPLYSIHLLIAA